MNDFQECKNTADLVPLYLPQKLFLKPISKINISLQLPNVKNQTKSISHREIMEKVQELILPEKFASIKVVKMTIEIVRLEAELETKNKIDYAIDKLKNRMIKLKDFSDMMRVKAGKAKISFPKRQEWDEFFHTERIRNPKTAGRPDTIHLSKLPTKWFVPPHLAHDEEALPSEKILYRIFEKFGRIRNVDIPICDPYRKKMKDHISGLQTTTFDKTDYFEGYVQFKDYIGFTDAMDALCGMKLVHKEDDGAVETNIVADYDKTKHLSEATIRRREIVRERLIKKAREKEEKDKRDLENIQREQEILREKDQDLKNQKERQRKLREERRKSKVLEKLKISGSDEINEKIAKEEKKLMKAQRKLEAIRLVEELFRRIKDKQAEVGLNEMQKNIGHQELKMYKNTSELAVLTQKEKLHNAIKGRVMLKTILLDGRRRSSSSSSSLSLEDENKGQRKIMPIDVNYNAPMQLPQIPYEPWMGFAYHMPQGIMYPPPNVYHTGMENNFPGPSRGGFRGRGRGYNPRFRGGYRGRRHLPDEEYSRYFTKFLDDHDNRHTRSSRSFSRGRSKSPSRRRSYTKSRSRSYSRCRSRYRSSSRSRSRSKRRYTRSRSRSRSVSETKRSKSDKKSRSRSRSRSRSKKDRVQSPRTSPRKLKEKSRSKSREKVNKSVERKSRSKSWSLPKEGEPRNRSWSKSPDKN
ncbi:unnamed protein product [Brassicogethes aeneus]|uniref:A-kinase anchor protein 17A n=1 Tax=Brassicogethes aeneus TaxID=1431903 RepID=A0A9P0B0X8_BRAAE|nr:unnamed protein product [Brassicogethes aeneus]